MSYKLVAKNTFYQLFGRGVTSFIGFLITILIARSFGAVGYGDFTKVISYVSIFYLFVDFGLNAIYVKEDYDLKKFFSARLIIAFLLFVIANAIAFILPYNINSDVGFSEDVKLAIFIYSFSIFIQSIIYSASAYFQKKLNYFNYMLSVVFGAVVSLVLVFTLTFLKFSIFYVFFAFLFSATTTAFLLKIFIKEKFLSFSISKQEFKKLLIKYGEPAAIYIAPPIANNLRIS